MIKIIMAPLEGVTDRTLRSCFYDHFPGLHGALTPFLPIPDRVKRVPLRNLRDVALPGESPVHEIPQLLVSESSAFLIAGKALERAGYREVNWNLGCPSKGVVRKGKGSGLLPHTDHILKVLDTVLPRLNLKLSLKIRLGLEQCSESFRLLPRLKDYPIAGLTLHPRLGSQMYSGKVDLEGFEEALELYGQKICYNGDITTLSEYRGLKARFPMVDEWMIGRGLLANPLLVNEILTGNLTEEQKDHPLKNIEFRNFIDDLLERKTPQFQKETALINYLKGVLLYTFESELMPPQFKKGLLQLKTIAGWQGFMRGVYLNIDSGFLP